MNVKRHVLDVKPEKPAVALPVFFCYNIREADIICAHCLSEARR